MLDLFIIGGGPAGYNAAKRAAELGMSVTLAETCKLGGVCLNEGCIPTKTLLHSAKLYDGLKNAAFFGVEIGDSGINPTKVIERKNQVVASLVKGVGMQMKAAGVEVINSNAEITGIDGGFFTVSAGGQYYQAKNILIATGSRAAVPPIPGLDGAFEKGAAVTSREALDIIEAPSKLTVIGGGVVGMELASWFNSIGSNVTVVEALGKIGGQIDDDAAAVLKKNYEKKGVRFLLDTVVSRVDGHDVMVTQNDVGTVMPSDKILVCTGRKPVIENIGLEAAGVVCEKGKIVTNENMETNVPGIYAAGDVNGVYMLAHVAYREGEVAVNRMAGIDDIMNYSAVPSVIYTSPEVASAGACENGSLKVYKTPLNYSGRYIAENGPGDGFVKLLTDEAGHLAGGSVVGPYASEIIVLISALIEKRAAVEEIKRMIFPHPTVGEILRECLFREE